VVEFMAAKGIDISRQMAKSVDQVPHWERCQVLIALTDEARGAFSAPGRKTIHLAWVVQDPAEVQGAAEIVQAAFESAYQFLDSHIRELVGAILGNPEQDRKL
jgi:protein-tyrosine-phosphatase